MPKALNLKDNHSTLEFIKHTAATNSGRVFVDDTLYGSKVVEQDRQVFSALARCLHITKRGTKDAGLGHLYCFTATCPHPYEAGKRLHLELEIC
jgi:hypothetical protein